MAKHLGLTPAMREKLLLVAHGKDILERDWVLLCQSGLASMQCRFRALTPRGFAALAAPRMTAAELACLEAIEDGGAFTDDKEFSRPAKSICERGFVTPINPGEYDLTTAGLTALNNVRAAMPGEWKPL